MAVNSHIQLPEAIIRNFREKTTGRVWYLSLQDQFIHKTSSDKLGAEFGYYSEDGEEILSKMIEAPLGAIASKISHFVNSKEYSVVFRENELEAVKQYIVGLMARSQIALDAYEGHLTFLQWQRNAHKHDNSALSGIVGYNRAKALFENMSVSMLLNESNWNFVVPRNGFYSIRRDQYDCIIVPVTPQFAFELSHQGYDDSTEDRNITYIRYISDPEIIKIHNTRALLYEYVYNRAFVASASKAELLELQKCLKDNIETLENERSRLIK